MTENRILHIEYPMHSQNVASLVHHFNVYDKFTDICFVCEKGVKVKAHKLLLCSLSSFMKQMMLSLPEFVWHDTVTIHVPDVDSGTMRLLMDFLYEGFLKVQGATFTKIQNVMNILGINLQINLPEANVSEVSNQVLTQQPPPSQVTYAAPNSQSHLQFIMATNQPSGQIVQGPMMTSLVQGSIAQQTIPQATVAQGNTGKQTVMTQANHGQIMHCAVAQPSMVLANNGQMVLQGSVAQQQQSATHQNMMQQSATHQNMIVTQANAQMIQGVPQVMSTNQYQQSGFPQQMVANQGQMINNQPSMPGQPVMINTTHMPTHVQNQGNSWASQPRPMQQHQQTRHQVLPQPSVAGPRARTPQQAGVSTNNPTLRGRRMMRGHYATAQNRPATMNRRIQRNRIS